MTITRSGSACVEAAFEGDVEAVAYTEGSQLNAEIGGHNGSGLRRTGRGFLNPAI